MTQVYVPRDLDELWDLLQREPDAELYAGGTDLLVKMRSGLVSPGCLVCLERIDALGGVRDDGDSVFVGATTTHSQLLESPLICTEFPVLTKALGMLGSPPIRHMGTIGGNIVTASPAADSLPPLTVLGADVEVASASLSRRIPLSLFVKGPSVVDLGKGEVLMGVWIPKQRAFNVHHYEKVGRRKSQVCGVASMAALLEVSESGTIGKARLAWGCVGPTMVVSPEIEQTLAGKPFTMETLKAAASLVEEVVSPIDDIRASAEYRRWLAGALLVRLGEHTCRAL
jgi:xanthine dehydrogenase FAD-binding subunit